VQIERQLVAVLATVGEATSRGGASRAVDEDPVEEQADAGGDAWLVARHVDDPELEVVGRQVRRVVVVPQQLHDGLADRADRPEGRHLTPRPGGCPGHTSASSAKPPAGSSLARSQRRSSGRSSSRSPR
jgi:hypothetical protein